MNENEFILFRYAIGGVFKRDEAIRKENIAKVYIDNSREKICVTEYLEHSGAYRDIIMHYPDEKTCEHEFDYLMYALNNPEKWCCMRWDEPYMDSEEIGEILAKHRI